MGRLIKGRKVDIEVEEGGELIIVKVVWKIYKVIDIYLFI